jgi:hypothetical protein
LRELRDNKQRIQQEKILKEIEDEVSSLLGELTNPNYQETFAELKKKINLDLYNIWT